MHRVPTRDYEIVGVWGGGMGEVHRARDTKLHRDVALKVLPEGFTRDPERLARFQREAEILASLSHPNIAAIHGLVEDQLIQALVLELVEGPTLPERVARGPSADSAGLPISPCRSRTHSRRPRARRHPPRSEAGEHQDAARRHREDPRFRTRQVADRSLVDRSVDLAHTTAIIASHHGSLLGTAAA